MPLKALISVMAAVKALTAVVTRACSSARVSTPEPSSALAAMAASTAARLSVVTPVMPSEAKLSAVKAGLSSWPAAVFNTLRYNWARLLTLSVVLVASTDSGPMKVLNPLTCAAFSVVMPMLVYSVSVGAGLDSDSP